MHQSHDLSIEECARLLSAGIAGRVACDTPDGPFIVPVNYVVEGESILIRMSPYSELGRHCRDARVCFEVDQFDYENHRGWSVMVRGRASVVADAEERSDITWEPHPWASGQRNLLVRVPWSDVTGRRLGEGWDPWDTLPVRRHV
jgi:nitroimidazol reductase NimA-like FMN-containing flavoprotein (pyridoxamine 5'-phosphate oxidase superfamily)